MKKVLLFVFLIFSNPAFSEKLPDWVTDVPPCNTSECFYVGQGKNAKEAATGAKLQAICHQFGCDFQSTGSTDETSSSVDYSNYTREEANAYLKGFKQTKSATVAGTTYLLFSYSKKEIEAERKRRETGKQKAQQVMGERNSQSGTLNLLTKDRENGNLIGDAIVFIDGKEYNKSVMQIYLDAGTHRIKISHPFYETKTDKIVIRKGEEESPTIQLKPAEISVYFSSEDAPDAEVFLNGKKAGQLPGAFKIKLARKNVFIFKHPEFTDGMKVFGKTDLSNDDNGYQYTVQMDEKRAYLKVSVTPATVKANIIVDEKVIGQTGVEKQRIAVSRGSHILKIKAAGYYEESETFTAKGGQTVQKHFDLRKDRRNAPALVSFVTKPVVADVYVDGEKVGQSNGSPIEIFAGEHDFKLSAVKYLDKTGKFKVKAGETFSGKYTLKKNEQEWAGRISFKTNPVTATVYIDGAEFGPADGTLRDIFPGKHTYSLRYNGYAQEKGTVSVGSEEVRHMPVVNLKKNAGQVSFTTRPVTADVYVDDELIGTANGRLIDVNPGFHFYSLQARGYFDHSGTFEIKTGQTVHIPPVVLEKANGDEKSNVQRINPNNPLIDKAHRFFVQKRQTEPLSFSGAKTFQDMMDRFHQWDYWPNFIQVAASHTDIGDLNVFVRYRLDREKYEKHFTANIKPYLRRFVKESKDDLIHIHADYLEVPDFSKWNGCNYKYAPMKNKDFSAKEKKLTVIAYMSDGSSVKKSTNVETKVKIGSFCPDVHGRFKIQFNNRGENVDSLLINVEDVKSDIKSKRVPRSKGGA